MEYTPTNSVWEITYACNMRCKHCGSSCGTKYPDELNLEEALQMCTELAAMRMKVVTLSGGEPFMHTHWEKLARCLSEQGVMVNAISNGWFIDTQLVKKARKAGILNIGVSLDGMQATHDFIRMPGAFEHVLRALDAMNAEKMPSVICTSVNKRNFPELPRLKELLYEKQVQRWQFQIASPMGNLLAHPELLCEMSEAERLIDFSYEVMQEGKITIDLADDLGYFNIKENEIRKRSFRIDKAITVWQGCQAGKCVMGIRANGDITGCLSIRDDNFIEGNVRAKPLREIWGGKDAFAWNRRLSKEKLTGFCGKCQYANYCLGGCTGLKLTFSGSIYDNKYCSFRLAVEEEAQKVNALDDLQVLKARSKQAMEETDYQIAELYLDRLHRLEPADNEVVDLLGYVHYFLENYQQCRKFNVLALTCNQQNAYAHKGLGLCLAAMGEPEEGISHLRKAILFAAPDFTDPYFDLAVVLDRQERSREALQILEQGRAVSAAFIAQSEEMYNYLREKAGPG